MNFHTNAINDNKATMNAPENTANNDKKGILEKTRDYIHQKVATDDQLLQEKPMSEQIKAKLPNNSKDAAETIDSTISAVMSDVKTKFNERLDEGTERAEQRKQKEQQSGPGVIGKKVEGVKSKLYEATKPPEVKTREEFREKPFAEKVQALAKNETTENLSEILA
jgi:hypothetical protein